MAGLPGGDGRLAVTWGHRAPFSLKDGVGRAPQGRQETLVPVSSLTAGRGGAGWHFVRAREGAREHTGHRHRCRRSGSEEVGKGLGPARRLVTKVRAMPGSQAVRVGSQQGLGAQHHPADSQASPRPAEWGPRPRHLNPASGGSVTALWHRLRMESGGATSFCAGLLEPPPLLPAGCGPSPDSSESLRRWNEEGPGDAGPRATCISAVTCQVLSRPSELLAG